METDIVSQKQVDEYLNRLMNKRYCIQHFISSNLLSTTVLPTQSPSHQVEYSISSDYSSSAASAQANSNTHRPIKWQTFWDSFKAAVHDNNSLYNSRCWTNCCQIGPIVACFSTSSTLQLNATVLKAIVTKEREEETFERFWNVESTGSLTERNRRREKRVHQKLSKFFDLPRKWTIQC